jgi:hypothetical protein
MTTALECARDYASRRDADPDVTALLEVLGERGIDGWPFPGRFESFVRATHGIREAMERKGMSEVSRSFVLMRLALFVAGGREVVAQGVREVQREREWEG